MANNACVCERERERGMQEASNVKVGEEEPLAYHIPSRTEVYHTAMYVHLVRTVLCNDYHHHVCISSFMLKRAHVVSC